MWEPNVPTHHADPAGQNGSFSTSRTNCATVHTCPNGRRGVGPICPVYCTPARCHTHQVPKSFDTNIFKVPRATSSRGIPFHGNVGQGLEKKERACERHEGLSLSLDLHMAGCGTGGVGTVALATNTWGGKEHV